MCEIPLFGIQLRLYTKFQQCKAISAGINIVQKYMNISDVVHKHSWDILEQREDIKKYKTS